MKRAFIPEDGSMGNCGSRLRCEERLLDLSDHSPAPAASHDAQGHDRSPLLPAPPSPGAGGPAALSRRASGAASASAGPWAGAWPAAPADADIDADAARCTATAAIGAAAAGDASDACQSGSAVWEMIRSELDAQSQLEGEAQQRSAQAWQGAQCCACSTGGCAQHQAAGSPPFVHGANSAASAAGPHNYGGPGACEACRRAAWFGDGCGCAAPAGPFPGGPRRLLVGWMAELAAAAALQPGTLFGAVSLLDRWVLGAQPPPPGPLLQLMGLAAVWVAGKVEEVYPLSPGQLLPLALDAATGAQLYTLADLARAELLLLASPHIAWRARTPTPLDLLHLLLTAAEEGEEAATVAVALAACGRAEREPSSPQPARAASPPAPGRVVSRTAYTGTCPPTLSTAASAVYFADLRGRATQLLVRSLVAGGPALARRHPAALALDALGAAEGPGPAWGGARGGGGVVRALLARAAALGMPRERLAPGLWGGDSEGAMGPQAASGLRER